MKNFKVVLVLMVGLLSGCELTNDGGDDRVARQQDTVSGPVSGRAVKGVLKSARVQAYAIEAGGLRWLAETTTDSDGGYTLALSGVKGPVLLEVSPAAGATMRCDAVSGCGSSVFGDDVGLRESFRLTAVVLASEIGQEQIAVTPLTHIAAEWARSLDSVPDSREIRLARSRVAGILSVSQDFSLRNVPDITDADELAASDAPSAGLAVMSAAFMEAEQRWGEGFLEDMALRFRIHAGQLPERGPIGNLHNLLDAAVNVATRVTGHEAMRTMASSLKYRRDHLGTGVTNFQEPMIANPSHSFETAKETILGLQSALGDFGINENGDFMRRRQQEYAWLANEDTQAVIEGLSTAFGASLLISAIGDIVEGLPINFHEDVRLYRYYPENRAVVILDGPVFGLGTDIDLQIEMPLARQVLAEREPLEFHMKGRISSGNMTMHVDNTVLMDPLDSNPMPMIIAMDTALIAGEQITLDEFLRESEEYFTSLHGKVRVDGSFRLSSLQGRYEEINADLGMLVNVDFRNLNGSPDQVELLVDTFSTTDLQGRELTRLEDVPLISMKLGEDINLSSAFRVAEHGRALMEIRHSLVMPGTGEEFVQSSFQSVPYTEALRSELMLDFPLRSSSYRFVMEDNRMSVSESYSNETAFEARKIGRESAVLYSGEQVIGTLAVDASNGKMCFLLLDGTRECLQSGIPQMTMR